MRQQLGVPPVLDLAGHFRDLRKMMLPALVAAAVVFVVVFGLGFLAKGNYQATATARIVTPALPGNGDPDTAAKELQAPYVALSTDTEVLKLAADRSKLGIAPDKLADEIKVTGGQAPTLLAIEATADSSVAAGNLVDALISALNEVSANRRSAGALQATELAGQNAAIIQQRIDQLDPASAERQVLQADLQRLIDKSQALSEESIGALTMLARPTVVHASIDFAAVAAVLAILTAILVAEGGVAVRGRFGSRVTVEWARRRATSYGTGLHVETSGEPTIPAPIELAAQRDLSLGGSVLLVSAKNEGGAVGRSFDAALEEQWKERVQHATLGERWWAASDGTTFRPTLAIVVAQSGQTERALVEATMSALAEVEIPVQLVVLEGATKSDTAAIGPKSQV